jgi:hypothetical protein
MKMRIKQFWIFQKTIKFMLFFLMTCNAILARGQGNIFSITGPPDITSQYSATLALDAYPAGISLITTEAYINVDVSISLAGDSGGMAIAYLTTKIGPGTTTANQIASTSFDFPSTPSLAPIFSGLNLAAGTYYLIIEETAEGSSGNGLWNGTPSPDANLAANVTDNGEYSYFNSTSGYIPAAPFSRSSINYLDFAITGSAVPEPAAAWLALFGGGFFVFMRTRNRVGVEK